MDLYPVPDIGHVSFSGLSEPCSIGSIVEVVINAHGDSSAGSILVEAIAPSGCVKNCHVLKKGSIFTATFTPNEVGKWQIGILYDGDHIRGSPFSCKVYDANLVQVYGLDVGLVGQELKFSVNASQAGDGFLKVSVLRHGRSLPCEVLEQGNSGVYRISFTPDGAGQYKIHVLFNNMEVKGSPFILDIADASSVSVYGENLRMASVDRLNTFFIHAVGAECKDITVTITAPSGKSKRARVYQTDDVTHKVEWKPVEAGEHSIDVRLFNQSVYESPFICNVGDPDLVTVRNMPEFINADELFRDYTFEIDASAAGSGNLEIMINGGRVACRVRELGGRHYLASFTPTQAIIHIVEMRFNGENVRMSPWKIQVRGSQHQTNSNYDVEERMVRSIESRRFEKTESWYTELAGIGLQRASVGKPTAFEITGDGITETDVQARIYGPDGTDLPISVYRRGDNKLICEYVINKVGDHHLEMAICGKKIDPYPLTVSGYSAENVKIEPLGGGTPGQPVQFIVDAVDAGKGQLEISINQGKVPNNVQMQGAGRCLVTFIPQYPGKYVIDVTFNGEQVQGCPIRVDILPKQVGQSVSTSIISQQTATITSSSPVQKPISCGLSMEDGAESSGSSALLKHTREKSLDRSSLPERPKSPDLLRKAELKTAPLNIENRYRLRKIDDYDPLAREKERETDQTSSCLIDKKDDRLGYMVAQYGNGTVAGANVASGQTVSSRTFTDDGRGIVTSTYTAETRYNNVSPARTYEYAKGTMTNLPHDERTATPSMYTEVRAFEIPKSKELTSSVPSNPSDLRAGSHSYLSFLEDSRIPSSRIMDYDINRVKSFGQLESGSSFITDSRSYDTKFSSEYRDLDSSSYSVRQYGTESVASTDQRQTQLKYFGEESMKSDGTKTSKSDIDLVKTTSESCSSMHDPIPSGGYLRNKYDSDQLCSNGYLKHEDELLGTVKGPNFEAPVIASYGRLISDNIADRQQKASQKIFTSATVLERSEEMERLPQSWESVEKVDANTGCCLKKSIKGGKPEMGENHQHTGVGEQSYRNMNAGKNDERCFDLSRPVEEPFQTLSRDRDMEPVFLSTAPQRTADYMRAREEGKFGAFQEMDSVLSSQSPLKFNYNEREGHITDIVEEAALTPGTRRKLQEQKIQREEELDQEKRGGARKAIKDDLQSMQALDRDEFELSQSKPSSPSPVSTPRATPRLNLKFGKDKEKKGIEEGAFNFGKSKITSKHEIVRRGKDVEVKVDSLKLGKDDQLKVIVVLAAKGAVEREEIEPKVKKSRHSYEISFRPAEIGTHKVMIYVNDTLHPMCPFPIRVYDASEIIVGEIAPQSTINDTVEFTVDAGRAGFGNLEMAIKDSDGIIIPSHVAQLETGTAKFLVTFNPTTLGMHTVNITFNKEVLKNSPFEVNIVDEKPCEEVENILVDGKKKDSRKEKEEKRREEKERVKKEKEEKLMAETLKKNKGKETKKKKHQVEKRTSVSKIPSLSRVGRPAHIFITLSGEESLDITVADPEKRKVESSMSDHEPGVKKFEFIPVQVGDHEIEVKYAGVDVQGSPFTCRAYDPAKISVGDIPNSLVDRPVHFIVDASQAGVGNLEVAVNEGRIPSMAQSLGQHRYDISFVPRELADHTISVRFNNEPVPGSPFICHLVKAQSVAVSGPGLERIPVGQVAQFYVVVEGMKDMLPQIRITDSQGKNIPVSISKNDVEDKKYIISYTPKNVGNHQIDISCDGKPITGSPFTSKAFDAKCAKLSCIEEAVVGRPCTFMIDAARAGAGNMEIIVSVENRNVPNFVQAEGQAKFKVSFTPQEAKDHLISVRFNGDPIPGSPMVCPVREKSSQLAAAMSSSMNAVGLEQDMRLVGDLTVGQVGQTKGFSIDTGGRETDCNVSITDSRGRPLPVRCYKQHDDSYWVEFTPENIGVHQIEITFADAPVVGSPFKCIVVDPRKVFMKGINEPFIIKQPALITVNRQLAGSGDLTVELIDPSDEPVRLDMQTTADGDDIFEFTPTKIGQYKLSTKLAGFLVNGTPHTLTVEEYGKPILRGSAMEHPVEVDRPTSIIFDAKNLKGNLKIDVRGPKKAKVRHTANKNPDGTTEISFTPTEVGRYLVNIEHNNRTISGSPFEIEVVDPRKVVVNDHLADEDGIYQFAVQQRNVIDVDATAAGSGKLRAEVRDWDGKSVSGCDVESLGYGKYRVAYYPHQPGKYGIYLYWSDIAVQKAQPLHVVAEGEQPSTSRIIPLTNTAMATSHNTVRSRPEDRSTYEGNEMDYLRVILRGEGLTRAANNEQAEFIIDGSDVSRDGQVSSSLFGQKADIPVRLTHLGNNVYKAIYTPLIPGVYELQVLWNGHHVRGSPCRVQVDLHSSAAEAIIIDANTLKMGIVNEDVKTIIDTRKAGPGQLSAQCMGPTKLAYCELYDLQDGTYTLSVRPSEIGKHTLVVKYSDEQVPGSPFTFNVSYPPDASKVRVYGPGIEHGILSTFKSNFIVETKGAGAGQLTVRVRGPKGAFNVEMQREKKQERTIHCKYEPKEPGDYQVEIKWHGEHVPGSPFLVMIVDTEQELQRFLCGDAPSPQPATPFIPPGWIGTPPPPPLFLGVPPPRGPFLQPHSAVLPLPSPTIQGAPVTVPHGSLLPYGAVPQPPHTMRTAIRPRFMSGY
ncbi:Uncharacterized protein BM_BM2319 [Brugia malayi]|uniref:BMA-FLN-2, isoform a; BMA-FLN-2, isoform c n=1 Tax=Brugia malayi TaxID=6279 RepID=A0A0H5SM06_BRUMA|nr:Uncharacterized protein BM_BM2319 [Brugia malayi]CRZ24757.1 BMA-FLN-2, isoform e [Brugia malayi]VIO89184.1 Uncharacterized protein BM_BM2319 [Brugia malayi]